MLFPVREQQYLAENIPNAEFVMIDSPYGHDGFLLEFEVIAGHLGRFLMAMRMSRRMMVTNG